ncbi:MAG: sulfatase-like hydrolase/transferase [Patescibacteria group bacterium]|nr:sulfatase-like hydrolase/transferase [Patescibacteria group bacterium]
MSQKRKKYIIGCSFVAFILLFAIFQFFFLKNVLGIFPSGKEVLPKGFCKDCNVILISLDTLRAKSLSCYGNDKDTSPNLCNFAKKSFLFKDTYSQSAYTLDSHFSIFTSLLPTSHKMTVPFVSNLSDQITTLTQVLQKSGYLTLYAGPLGDINLPLDKGLGKGFDYIEPAIDPQTWMNDLNKDIDGKHKFFAFFHTYWVHEPYIPKREDIKRFYSGPANAYISEDDLCIKTYEKLIVEHPERFPAILPKGSPVVDYCNAVGLYAQKYDSPTTTYDQHLQYYHARLDSYWETFSGIELNERKKYMQALYEARVYELDLEMKRFFQFLKDKNLLKNTVVVITADHGEAFYEHGEWTHGFNLYNEVIHVPLIVYIPYAKSQVVNNLTESIDIAPSILHLLGISIPKQFMGIDLFSNKVNNAVISEHFASRKRAIITKTWKLIINFDNPDGIVTRELYNLENDYTETKNVASEYPEIVTMLENSLNSTLAGQPVYEQKNNQPFPTWVDENQRKKLIQTGYF